MKNIVFQEIGMENFGPYIDPMVLTFENDKLTLITGPNGIGKTMSLEAIPFTLFGETCKKVKGDDVVNNETGRNCHTWVKFSIDDDDVYQVDRYHKYTKLQNTVTIRKNGEEPYKKGHREVLPEVEKLICSKKSFTNTLMFGQKVRDFFTDIVDSDKKEIFRQILNLHIYTTWYKEADDELKQIKQNLQKVLEQIGIDSGILSDNENQINILFKQKKQHKEDKEQLIDKVKKSIEDNQRLLTKWENEKNILVEKEETLETIQTQITDVEKQKQHHENEKNTIILKLQSSRDTKIAEMKEAANKATQKVVKANRQSYDILLERHKNNLDNLVSEENEIKEKMEKISNNISSITTEKIITQTSIDKLNNSLKIDDGVCPTCLRDIDDDCRSHLEKEHLNYINSYNASSNKEKALNEELKQHNQLREANTKKQLQQNKSYTDAKNELIKDEAKKELAIENKLNETLTKIDRLTNVKSGKIEREYVDNIENLSNKLTDLNIKKQDIIKVNERVQEIDNTIATLQQNKSSYEFQLKQAEEDKYDEAQLAAHQSRKQELEKSIKELNENIIKLQKEETVTAFWKLAWSPSGIPSMLIDEAIPFMNKKVSEYLDKLSNGRYIVSFDTLATTKSGEFRDKISVNVLDTHTRANSRIQLSGGQTRLIDIATILTLGDLQSHIQDININILLFDEIFDSLDEENIGFVSKILSQLKIGKSIYLISHTQVEQLEADEVLELK